MMFDIEGRKGIVFGAAGGIGVTLCSALARSGAAIAVCDINEDDLGALGDSIHKAGGQSCQIACDVTQGEDVDGAVNRAVEHLGRIDFAVNLAFAVEMKPIIEMTGEQFERTISVCLTGAFNISHAVGRAMTTRGGSVVHFSSIAGSAALGRGTGAYAASKAGINALVRELAVEWGPHDIRINAIAPCQTRTETIDRVLNNPELGGREVLLKKMVSKIPLGRLAEPDDMVGPCLFLISDASRMVSGHVLFVDGGYMAQ